MPHGDNSRCFISLRLQPTQMDMFLMAISRELIMRELFFSFFFSVSAFESIQQWLLIMVLILWSWGSVHLSIAAILNFKYFLLELTEIDSSICSKTRWIHRLLLDNGPLSLILFNYSLLKPLNCTVKADINHKSRGKANKSGGMKQF